MQILESNMDSRHSHVDYQNQLKPPRSDYLDVHIEAPPRGSGITS